jgi:16S rRNA (guanine1516-N2)-methyltransferase
MPAHAQEIGLVADSHLLVANVRRLTARFALPLLKRPPDSGFFLYLTVEGLELRQADAGAPGPIQVEFAAGAMGHRRRFGGGRGQALARAVGMKPGFNPTVWDATAGLGRDGFVLASLGCRVTLCERSRVLAAMLADGLQRAALHSELRDWFDQRIQLVHADARQALRSLDTEKRPDVVYLDPMYPAGKDHVLVKKEIRALQQILGPDLDSQELLDVARQTAGRRVVVKRPRRAGWLHRLKPDTCIESKKTRYDVYVTLNADKSQRK